jgi:hypothetical protein
VIANKKQGQPRDFTEACLLGGGTPGRFTGTRTWRQVVANPTPVLCTISVSTLSGIGGVEIRYDDGTISDRSEILHSNSAFSVVTKSLKVNGQGNKADYCIRILANPTEEDLKIL